MAPLSFAFVGSRPLNGTLGPLNGPVMRFGGQDARRPWSRFSRLESVAFMAKLHVHQMRFPNAPSRLDCGPLGLCP